MEAVWRISRSCWWTWSLGEQELSCCLSLGSLTYIGLMLR